MQNEELNYSKDLILVSVTHPKPFRGAADFLPWPGSFYHDKTPLITELTCRQDDFFVKWREVLYSEVCLHPHLRHDGIEPPDFEGHRAPCHG